jgi:DNA-binding NarL/FixJ family response regulator
MKINFKQMKNERVLIIEDSEFTSALINEYLLSQNYVVCGIASSFSMAKTLFEIHQPTIIICDIHLDGNKNGIELINTIKLSFPPPLVIFTSSDNKREILLKAQKTKPNAYLTKPFTKEQLITAIEIAIITRQEAHFSNFGLNMHDVEVLRLLGQGKSNKQIGAELFISHHTVDSRRRKILIKLNVNSINQALCLATEKEWFHTPTCNAEKV